MESRLRTIMKSLTWQTLGIVTMTCLSYHQVGTLAGALSLSISASLTGFVFFFLHERVWSRVRWGIAARRHDDTSPGSP